jgi:hypothetical protein
MLASRCDLNRWAEHPRYWECIGALVNTITSQPKGSKDTAVYKLVTTTDHKLIGRAQYSPREVRRVSDGSPMLPPGPLGLIRMSLAPLRFRYRRADLLDVCSASGPGRLPAGATFDGVAHQ